MDILLLILGFILMLVGMIGSVLPVLPGTPISWIGIIVLHLAPSVPFNWTIVIITGVIAIAIYILDYIIPSIGTKKFGGSRAGAIGTFVVLIVGILAPIPFGILIGPFVGALIGEMAFNQTEGGKAVKAAFGSFLGFLASTFMKLVFTVSFFIFFLYLVWDYRDLLF